MRKYAAAMILALSAPAAAFAQADNDKGGLPQFDTSLFPGQLFWLAVSFCLLYSLMSLIALPRVARTQDNRKKTIASELEAARAANDAAKATVAQVEKSLTEARARAHGTVSEMIAKVAEESALRQTAQERELQRRLHRSEADIAVTREAALNAVRDSAADLAATLVEKIVGSKMRVES